LAQIDEIEKGFSRIKTAALPAPATSVEAAASDATQRFHRRQGHVGPITIHAWDNQQCEGKAGSAFFAVIDSNGTTMRFDGGTTMFKLRPGPSGFVVKNGAKPCSL
jgi:hypothetical protein